MTKSCGATELYIRTARGALADALYLAIRYYKYELLRVYKCEAVQR